MAEIKVQIGKGERGQQENKVRVAPYLDDELHQRLRKLAWACNTSKADLALRIMDVALNHPGLINYLQDLYKVKKDDRVIPVVESGKCTF